MSEEHEVFNKLAEAETIPDFAVSFTGNYKMDQRLAEHKAWLKTIRHEQPSPKRHFRVGIYIRYYNQTKHDNRSISLMGTRSTSLKIRPRPGCRMPQSRKMNGLLHIKYRGV